MSIDRGITVPSASAGSTGASPGTQELHLTDVDGVPAVWADVPGPLWAGLLLRMGTADETLAARGVSHMLEHLALFGTGRPGDHSNGRVDLTTTLFHTTGDPAAVGEFLNKVTAHLVDPPVGRMVDEKGVLHAEAAGRSTGPFRTLSLWRWGAGPYGAAALDEHGLHQLDEQRLRAWSGRFAVRSNAVLLLSGPPPAGLRLSLGAGPRVPAPDPTRTVLPRLPAFTEGPGDSATVQSVVRGGWEAPVLRAVLRARLIDELRVRRAAAYAPDVDQHPLDGEHGLLTLATDLVHGRHQGAVAYLLDLLARVGEDGGRQAVRQEEVDEQVRLLGSSVTEQDALSGAVQVAAWQLLFGRPVLQPEEIRRQRAGVRAEDVAALARAAADDALALVPADAVPRGEPWTRAPECTAEPPSDGTVFRPVASDDPSLLLLREEGIAVRAGGEVVTVRTDATEAVLTWPDGRRMLVGADSSMLTVEPSLWRRGGDLVQEIDRRWPADVVVRMPERHPASVPVPASRTAVLRRTVAFRWRVWTTALRDVRRQEEFRSAVLWFALSSILPLLWLARAVRAGYVTAEHLRTAVAVGLAAVVVTVVAACVAGAVRRRRRVWS